MKEKDKIRLAVKNIRRVREGRLELEVEYLSNEHGVEIIPFSVKAPPADSFPSFVSQLNQQLIGQICGHKGWKREDLTPKQIITLKGTLENILLSSGDFESQYRNQFPSSIKIKALDLSAERGKKVKITYQEVSPITFYSKKQGKENIADSVLREGELSFPYKNIADVNQFIEHFASSLNKTIDDIWIDDRLSLRGRLLRENYEKRKKRRRIAFTFVLLPLIAGGVLWTFPYLQEVEIPVEKNELNAIRQEVQCIREQLESAEHQNTSRNTLLLDLKNIEIYLKGQGKATSDSGLNYLEQEIAAFKKKLEEKGFSLANCN